MQETNKQISDAIRNFVLALKQLRKLGIAPNSKDFTGQIGEWLVEILFDGKRAKSGIQKCWDVECAGKFIQVKAHAKAPTTGARFSAVNKSPSLPVDELIIIVFSNEYKIKEFYQVPWSNASELICCEKDRDVIYWNHLEQYKVPTNRLPKQEIVSLFL